MRKHIQQVVSLVLSLVMALTLCSGAWAASSTSTDLTTLRQQWGAVYDPFKDIDATSEENKAALEWVYTNFYPQRSDENGEMYLWMTGADRGGDFYWTETDKTKATSVLSGYTDAIANVLGSVSVSFGDETWTFDSYVEYYKGMTSRVVLQPTGGTGTVNGVNDKTKFTTNVPYVISDDVDAALTYFNTHFEYSYDDSTGTGEVRLKTTQVVNGSFADLSKVEDAVDGYYSADPCVWVILNQLKIDKCDISSDPVYFWQIIREYEAQSGNGGSNSYTGNITDPSQLTNAEAKAYLNKYIDYVYDENNSTTGTVTGTVTFKNAPFDSNGLYVNEAARKQAEEAYRVANQDLSSDAQDELNRLYVTDDRGYHCWFYERIRALYLIASNVSGSGTGNMGSDMKETVAALRNAGYKIPTLGRELTIDFSTYLSRWDDVDFTYDDTTGHMIITVKPGSGERWLKAAEDSRLADRVAFDLTFINVEDKSNVANVCGNGADALQPYIDGTMSMEEDCDWYSLSICATLASVNTSNGKRVVTSTDDNSVFYFLAAWGDDGDTFAEMDKYLITFEVQVETPFTYKESVPVVNKVALDRITTAYTGSNSSVYTEQRNEPGVLKLTVNSGHFYDGSYIGTMSISAPAAGYTLEWFEEKGGDSGTDNTNIALSNRSSAFYNLTWTKNGAETIYEKLTVYIVGENDLESLGSYDENGNTLTTPLPVGKPSKSEVTSPDGLKVDYDADNGFFYTTAGDTTKLTAYSMHKCVSLTPPTGVTGVTHVRVWEETGTDRPSIGTSHVKEIIQRLAGMTALDCNSNEAKLHLNMPYVMTATKELGAVTITYAASQDYHYKIAQWLRQEADGTYTVLGYSYISGKNSDYISTSVTSNSVEKPENAPKNTPFVIGANIVFSCERNPQESDKKYVRYFQLEVSGEGVTAHTGKYKVYIPYSYFGLTWSAVNGWNWNPKVYHYDDDHNLKETITGKFTQYGVYFETEDFSPFVIDLDPGSNVQDSDSTTKHHYIKKTGSASGLTGTVMGATDYTSGIYGLTFKSSASFASFLGVQVDGKTIDKSNYIAEEGSIEIYLKAVYLQTLAAGKHTVTILSSEGNVTMDFTIGGVNTSPQTFDAGIAVYVGMALTSALGTAAVVGKKKEF